MKKYTLKDLKKKPFKNKELKKMYEKEIKRLRKNDSLERIWLTPEEDKAWKNL
jgi:hypothetical protein